MTVDLVQIRTLAQQKEDENREFRRFVKFECKLDDENRPADCKEYPYL